MDLPNCLPRQSTNFPALGTQNDRAVSYPGARTSIITAAEERSLNAALAIIAIEKAIDPLCWCVYCSRVQWFAKRRGSQFRQHDHKSDIDRDPRPYDIHDIVDVAILALAFRLLH